MDITVAVVVLVVALVFIAQSIKVVPQQHAWVVFTGLALHLAAVGLIGLTVIVLATSFTGVTEEHALGKAFHEALPFTALLTVFFSVVAVIIDQQLF